MKHLLFIVSILSTSISYGMNEDISQHPWHREDVIEQSIECILNSKCDNLNTTPPKELVVLLSNIIGIKNRIAQIVRHGLEKIDKTLKNPNLLATVIKLESQCNALQAQEDLRILKQEDILLLISSIKEEYKRMYALYMDSHYIQGEALLLGLAISEYDIARERFITRFDMQTRADTKFLSKAGPWRERLLLWRSELIDLVDGYRIAGNSYKRQIEDVGTKLITLYQILESMERRVFWPPFGSGQYYQHQKKRLLSELQQEYSDILGKK